jgi:hypothetical protein
VNVHIAIVRAGRYVLPSILKHTENCMLEAFFLILVMKNCSCVITFARDFKKVS